MFIIISSPQILFYPIQSNSNSNPNPIPIQIQFQSDPIRFDPTQGSPSSTRPNDHLRFFFRQDSCPKGQRDPVIPCNACRIWAFLQQALLDWISLLPYRFNLLIILFLIYFPVKKKAIHLLFSLCRMITIYIDCLFLV